MRSRKNVFLIYFKGLGPMVPQGGPKDPPRSQKVIPKLQKVTPKLPKWGPKATHIDKNSKKRVRKSVLKVIGLGGKT